MKHKPLSPRSRMLEISSCISTKFACKTQIEDDAKNATRQWHCIVASTMRIPRKSSCGVSRWALYSARIWFASCSISASVVHFGTRLSDMTLLLLDLNGSI